MMMKPGDTLSNYDAWLMHNALFMVWFYAHNNILETYHISSLLSVVARGPYSERIVWHMWQIYIYPCFISTRPEKLI